jgi:hypothetical protein
MGNMYCTHVVCVYTGGRLYILHHMQASRRPNAYFPLVYSYIHLIHAINLDFALFFEFRYTRPSILFAVSLAGPSIHQISSFSQTVGALGSYNENP